MPQPRAEVINLESTEYYHCVSRCVRRAFLCGADPYSGECFEHRRGLLEKRLILLAEVFAIRLCAYAILSNHFHTVLRVVREHAEHWSEEEVIRGYGFLFPTAAAQLATLPEDKRERRIAAWRERLSSVSWFMRCVNEWLARRANREDECTGRFWEGRFRCQPLLDEPALLACMAYVDLNPIRAGIASTVENSHFTSARRRLTNNVPRGLLRFANEDDAAIAIPTNKPDYFEFLRWTAGSMSFVTVTSRNPTLTRHAGIRDEGWLDVATRSGLGSGTLGTARVVQREADRRNKKWLRGVGLSRLLFARPMSTSR